MSLEVLYKVSKYLGFSRYIFRFISNLIPCSQKTYSKWFLFFKIIGTFVDKRMAYFG